MAAAFAEDEPVATSVHITEFGDIRVNPQPIVQEEDTDVFLEEYLSPRKLVSIVAYHQPNKIMAYLTFHN